jgi:hypothetical protein
LYGNSKETRHKPFIKTIEPPRQLPYRTWPGNGVKGAG